jgi:hypothetical protein
LADTGTMAVKSRRRGQLGGERHQLGLVLHAVRLVDHQDHRHILRQQVQHLLVGRAEGAGLDQEQDHVGRRQRVRDGLVQRLVQRVRMAGLEARGVDVDELGVVAGLDAGDAVARGLGLARGDRHLGADQHVHQGRLAHVGTADDGDIAAAESAEGAAPRPGGVVAVGGVDVHAAGFLVDAFFCTAACIFLGSLRLRRLGVGGLDSARSGRWRCRPA